MTFLNEEDGTKAKMDLNGKVIDGRRIEVRVIQQCVEYMYGHSRAGQMVF